MTETPSSGDPSATPDPHCDACRRPVPDEISPDRRGWLRGSLQRQTTKGALLEPVALNACPDHHLYTLPRQLRAWGPGEPRIVANVSPNLLPPYRHCRGCRKPRSEPAPGWARVRVERVDRGELTFELCPECAVDIR
jgi:hypothetical protein